MILKLKLKLGYMEVIVLKSSVQFDCGGQCHVTVEHIYAVSASLYMACTSSTCF